MPLIQDVMPPTRENWETLLKWWQIGMPVFGSLQYVISWYGMGKTSVTSRLNLPGRFGWFSMEAPGFLTLLYIMNTLPKDQGISDLPWQNKVLAGLFVIHYSYRAVLFPYIAPSISPIHVVNWASAMTFQVCNGTAIGCWLAGYGPTTNAAWHIHPWSTAQFVAGIAVFYLGLAGNYYHDEELREIRRIEQRRQEKAQKQAGHKVSVEKHYKIPEAGLFRYMLYPHYFCEWIEWIGFWMAAGWSCVPARAFVINELTVMFPRAVNGRRWYNDRFGEEKIRKKWTAIPGIY